MNVKRPGGSADAGFERGTGGGFKKITFGKISLASSSSSGEPSVPVEPTKPSEVEEKQSAAESGGGGFGSFSWDKAQRDGDQSKGEGATQVSEEEEKMKNMMGFSDFGTSKKPDQQKSAKKFSVKELMEQIKSSKKSDSSTDTKIEVDMEGVNLSEKDKDSEEEDDEKVYRDNFFKTNHET